MSTTEIMDVIFNYELLGENTDAPPIVFIAGYTCDINFWRPVAQKLITHHKVLIFDNQGIFALGSSIAQRIAYDQPQKIKKLVLLSAVRSFSPSVQQICEQLCWCRENGQYDRYADLIYDNGFSKKYKSQLTKQDFRKDFIPLLKSSQTPKGQRRQVEALKSFNSTKWVGEIIVPTTVISPKEDLFAPIKEGEALVDFMRSKGRDAEIIAIENCGHSALTEQLAQI